MYAGVDIGGTKTLVAAIDENGVIIEKLKIPTEAEYGQFISKLRTTVESLETKEFRAGCLAIPGKVDRQQGVGKYFGNLEWHNVHIQKDAEEIFKCPLLIENDAKLGGLSESMLLPADKRILYITISTGIGGGLIDHRHIEPALADSEPGQMLLEYHGKRIAWEEFASGRAIVKRFGKKASEITEESTWMRIAHDLAIGFIEMMAIMQPDIIVVGGSVGRYFDRFKDYLLQEIEKYKNPLITIPLFQQAARPEEAVLYGCYDLAHSHYGRNY